MATTHESQSKGCEHAMRRQGSRRMFGKLAFKTVLLQKRDVDSGNPCELCTVVYPFWKEHIKDAYTELGFYDIRAEQVPLGISDNGDSSHQNNPNASRCIVITVALGKCQLGEAYHILMCRLLLQWNRAEDIKVHVIVQDLQDNEIPDLLNWYKIPFNREDSKKKMDGKKGASGIIADAFKSCRSRLKVLRNTESSNNARLEEIPESGQVSEPEEMSSIWPDQAALFDCFRGLLDAIHEWPQEDYDAGKIADIHSNYLRPSYATKFWLNRTVGRLMNDNILEYIVNAIKHANVRAEKAGEAPFSHFILYGDFVFEEGSRLQGLAAKAFTKDQVRVLYISRPWLPREKEDTDTDTDEKNDKVRQFWEKFRDPNFDPLPLQVKILAVWTALCKCYSPNVCVIGHRSGFIEGAAFVGIPVFYLNNERVQTHLTPGDILWKPVDPGLQSRLGELAGVANTFIPIDVLKDVDQEVGEKGKKKFVKTKVLDNKYKDDLMAALFIYMCCKLTPSSYILDDLIGNYPGWTARVEMMHDKCMDRHPERDECKAIKTFEAALNYLGNHMEGETSEAQKALCNSCQYSNSEKCKHDLVDLFTNHCEQSRQQTGQKWLKRRICFAKDSQLEPRFLLQRWSRTRVDQKRDEKILANDKKLLDSKAIQVSNNDYDTLDKEQIRRACELIANPGTPPDRATNPYDFKSNFNPHKSTIYCLQEMELFLRRNISTIVPITRSTKSRDHWSVLEIPWQVRYACQHWVKHYRVEKITDPWIVEQFLRRHLLHWIEAMSVLRMLPDVEGMLDALKTASQENPFFLEKQIPDVGKYVSLADLLDHAKDYVQFNLPSAIFPLVNKSSSLLGPLL